MRQRVLLHMNDQTIDLLLEGWASFMEADISQHGVSNLPSKLPTSKDYRAENQEDESTDIPLTEDEALRVQAAMNALKAHRRDIHQILWNRYRNRLWTAPHVLAWARKVFALYY